MSGRIGGAGRRAVLARRPSDRDARGVTVHWAVFAIPSLVLVALFFLLPFALNFPIALSDWSGYSSDISIVGSSNFSLLWQRGILGNAIRVTLIYAVICMAVQNIVSLALAIALKDSTRVNYLFRSVFFIPVLIAPLAAGYIWRAIVSAEGPLNGFIGIFIPGFDFAWLGDSATALFTVAFVDAWKWCGLATLVYIAGLNAIPKEILEAATIDGASHRQRFWRVTFPLLAPAFTFNIATTLIGALSAYDIVASTTGGGPGTATLTLNGAAVQQFGVGFFGSASALSLMVTILVILLGVPLITWLRRRELSG